MTSEAQNRMPEFLRNTLEQKDIHKMALLINQPTYAAYIFTCLLSELCHINFTAIYCVEPKEKISEYSTNFLNQSRVPFYDRVFFF